MEQGPKPIGRGSKRHEDEPLANDIVLLFTRRHLKQCCSELTDCSMLHPDNGSVSNSKRSLGASLKRLATWLSLSPGPHFLYHSLYWMGEIPTSYRHDAPRAAPSPSQRHKDHWHGGTTVLASYDPRAGRTICDGAPCHGRTVMKGTAPVTLSSKRRYARTNSTLKALHVCGTSGDCNVVSWYRCFRDSCRL